MIDIQQARYSFWRTALPEERFIDENRIYMKLGIGAGNARLTQKYIEKKLNVTATGRN